jgi:hypothetical protein
VPDSEGRPQFEDFSSASDVDAAFDATSPRQRLGLTIWQYALLRAERHSLPRPVAIDVSLLARRVALSRPLMVALRASVFALATAVFGYATLLSLREQEWLAFGIVITGLVIAVSRGILSTLRLIGPYGSAMRMVWRARDLERAERWAILEDAVRLDPELGRAQTHGQ